MMSSIVGPLCDCQAVSFHVAAMAVQPPDQRETSLRTAGAPFGPSVLELTAS